MKRRNPAWIALIALFLLGAECQTTPAKPTPGPTGGSGPVPVLTGGTPVIDPWETGGAEPGGAGGAGGVAPVSAPCEAANRRLVELGCGSLLTTPKGTPFREVCARAQADGRGRPDCVAEAATCVNANHAWSLPKDEPCR